MTLLTQKISKPLFAEAIHVLKFVLFVIAFGAGATLAQTKGCDTAASQVSFTATTSTGVITGVTKLPGGLTQFTGTASGSATHLGDVTASFTRIQDNQGNFSTITVLVGANGKDSVFISTSGLFEQGKGGDKCALTSTGTYTVTGGTGAFANATGSGTVETQADLCAGTFVSTLTGTISQPNSN